MNYRILLFASLSFLISCNLTNNSVLIDRTASLDEILYHQYTGESSVNAESGFGVLNRRIEFEYEVIALDSIAEVSMMLTTGYNEGALLKGIDIILKNDEVLSVMTTKVTSREYVETYNYNTTTPVSRQQMITDPGGTEIVVQQDGSQKQVYRQTSTKIVNVTENQINNHAGSKSQIFNQSKFTLSKEDLDTIKKIGIDYYKLDLENGFIFILPNDNQNKEISSYL